MDGSLVNTITQLWHEHEAEYISFPHITLTDDFAECGQKRNACLIIPFTWVIPLIEYWQNPQIICHHDYYEGGNYYAYPGGSSYFYDESTREITLYYAGWRLDYQ